MSQKINLSFALERVTPGAARYQELDQAGQPVTTANGAKVGTLYLRKTALGKDIPNNVKVEITI